MQFKDFNVLLSLSHHTSCSCIKINTHWYYVLSSVQNLATTDQIIMLCEKKITFKRSSCQGVDVQYAIKIKKTRTIKKAKHTRKKIDYSYKKSFISGRLVAPN
jgi:hypothetical protein